jgi:hypothetical protein
MKTSTYVILILACSISNDLWSSETQNLTLKAKVNSSLHFNLERNYNTSQQISSGIKTALHKSSFHYQLEKKEQKQQQSEITTTQTYQLSILIN